MQIDSNIAAVVTGGASGLGEAAARALAAQGAKVAIFDLQEERGEQVAADIGGVFCKVDITSEEETLASFAKARAAHGQERIMVNCAGTGAPGKVVSRDRETGEAKRYDLNTFRRIIEINLIATFSCLSISAEGMVGLDPLESGERGVIVNTGSIAAQDGQMGQTAYASSKGGVVGMTLPIARDLARDCIRINTILPGLFGTPPMLARPELAESLSAMVPFPKRLGDPAEFGSLVATLVSNAYFNGEVIRLDGAVRLPPR